MSGSHHGYYINYGPKPDVRLVNRRKPLSASPVNTRAGLKSMQGQGAAFGPAYLCEHACVGTLSSPVTGLKPLRVPIH